MPLLKTIGASQPLCDAGGRGKLGVRHQAATHRAGADLERVYTIEGVRCGDDENPIMLPTDLDLIEQKVKSVNAQLLVIDPLNEHIAAGIDTHKDTEMRMVTRRLKQLAERTGAAVLILRHPNKGAVDRLFIAAEERSL